MDSNAFCIVKIDEPTKIEIQEALKWVQEIFGARERERVILFTSLICRIKHTCFVYTKNIRKFWYPEHIFALDAMLIANISLFWNCSANASFLVRNFRSILFSLFGFHFEFHVWIKYRNLFRTRRFRWRVAVIQFCARMLILWIL